jgi:hypothetical protein
VGLARGPQARLDRGADIEARDTTWDSTPLTRATIGSGERPKLNPSTRGRTGVATVRTLIEAGASSNGLTLSPDDLKPTSPEVAQLLRAHGIGDEHSESNK